MPVVKRPSFALAVHNIARYGDTDVFPFPLENHWFHDEHDVIVRLLEQIDADFDAMVAAYPVLCVKSLTGVGYSGFRAATQIDPIWNAYLLALVLEIGADIEAARVSATRNVVFSYRHAVETQTSTIFDSNFGWGAYQNTALIKARAAEYVLATDISDFYPRIYHHRLDNALQQATVNKEAARRIKILLFRLSSETSYGLPVGGHAARILAELLLNRTDKLLLAHRVDFIRFVDDYYIFAHSREQSQSALVFVSESLLIEGLSLSRAKTRVMSRAEFVRSSPIADATVAESEMESEARQFLKIRLAYNPYSPTADDDYSTLSAELERFDIVGMLAGEFRKSRVDEVLVRQLVKSVRFLKGRVREQAVDSILGNLDVLYPVFPTVIIILRALLRDLEQDTRDRVFSTVRALVRSESHIVRVPANLAFALRLLTYDPEEETDSLLIETYNRPRVDMMIKRDILLAMARRRGAYWLSPALRQFSVVTPWERRALIAASYVLGDEGRHWRDSVRPQLLDVEERFLNWVGSKNNGQVWEIPL